LFIFYSKDFLSPITNIRGRRKAAMPQIVPTQRRRTVPPPAQLWQSADHFYPLVQNFNNATDPFHNEFDLDEEATPLQIMKYFWGDDVVLGICRETNRYANGVKANKNRTLKKWIPLTPEDYWRFMGLSTLMGLVKKTSVRDYWTTEEMTATPFFRKS